MTIKQRAGLIGAAVIAFAAFTLPASAATYLFTFQNDSSSVNFSQYGNVLIDGTFTVASALPSLITGVTGTVSGGNVLDGTITGMSPYAGSDNILYAPGPVGNYSFGGVSFEVKDENPLSSTYLQTADYNLFDWTGSTFLIFSQVDSVGYPTSGTQTGSLDPSVTPNLVSQVPEPAVWTMLLLGFGGIGFLLRGRRRDALAIA